MAQFILGILVGAGIAFTGLALVEIEENKKRSEWEKYEEWRRKLP